MTRFFNALGAPPPSAYALRPTAFGLAAALRAAPSPAAIAVTVAACVSFAAPARAQTGRGDAPAHISFVEGTATLERDGRADTAPGSMPLLAGDRLRTENGRVEVLFGDGSILHLDQSSTLDVQSDAVVRLMTGRVRLVIAASNRPVSYRVDAPAAWAQIDEPGEYKVAIAGRDRDAEVELAVVRGAASLVNDAGRTDLRTGERAFARADAAPSYAYVLNSAALDAFDQWSEGRRAERRGASAQYLPESVRSYSATFDQNGSWGYEPTYGYVWYPTVKVGWRPYYYGRWATLRPFGWTWIGYDPWAWPTHHYGRWGFSAGAWFWIPGYTWAPSWVSWAYAPGYVSWCPLGWDNRPVVAFNVAFHTGYPTGYGHYDPWRAWTVVPHQHFGTGFVHTNVVSGVRIDARTRSTFVARDAGPDVRGYAVPRSNAAIYTAGTRTAASGGIRTAPAFSSTRSAVPREGANVSPGAAEAFRSRGQSGGGVQGPGFPSPSRAPRESARTVTSPPAASATGGAPIDRRAATRGSDATETARQPAVTRRLDVPGYTRAPAADRRASGAADAAQQGTAQAVPRGSVSYAPRASEAASPAARAYGPYAPRAATGAPADFGVIRHYGIPPRYEPPDDRGALAPRGGAGADPARSAGAPDQAVPRAYGAPAATPPPQYRPGPGVERRGPAGPSGPSGPPPAQAAPAGPRGSGPGGGGPGGGGSGAASGGDGGHQRGGSQATGMAVRRGRG
jgi:uncharacterized protein DUF6600/FecR-like protein